ncbi:acyl carrier protein [Defluviimonas sp. WL0002]|nr:acyl carrier protein [Defluviimonas sp. WL0002]
MTKAEVIAILSAQSGVPAASMTAETLISDLGLDSLGLVETIFALEERFGVTIPFNANTPQDDSAFDLSTVAGIVSGIETLIARPAAA